jgi:hypothetical protein
MTDESSTTKESFMDKWGLIIRAAYITGALLVVRLVFDYMKFDILSVTNLRPRGNNPGLPDKKSEKKKIRISLAELPAGRPVPSLPSSALTFL